MFTKNISLLARKNCLSQFLIISLYASLHSDSSYPQSFFTTPGFTAHQRFPSKRTLANTWALHYALLHYTQKKNCDSNSMRCDDDKCIASAVSNGGCTYYTVILPQITRSIMYEFPPKTRKRECVFVFGTLLLIYRLCGRRRVLPYTNILFINILFITKLLKNSHCADAMCMSHAHHIYIQNLQRVSSV